jgi:hypothetical protein
VFLGYAILTQRPKVSITSSRYIIGQPINALIVGIRVCYMSVFFTPTRYMAINTAYSYSEVVLRTTKYTMIYPDSGSFLEVIALRPAVWYWRWTKFTLRWAEISRSSRGEGENDLVPSVWRIGAFYMPRSGRITMN